MNLGRAVATIGGLTLISRVLGFIRDVLSASLLGAGPIADAAFVAFRLPNLFRRLFAEGAFSVAFVPIFAGTLEKDGEAEAARFAEESQAVMLGLLIPLTVIVLLFMPAFMMILAPGFEHGSERYNLGVELSRITFPYLILISLAALQGGVLNALDRYWPFASAPILFNLCLILGLALAPYMKTPGHALAWGEALAGFVQFAWMWRACRKAGVGLKLRWPKLTPNVRRLFALMGPAAIGAGAAQINIYIDIAIASLLPSGAISYLYYADRLNQLPLGVIGIAVGTALLPLLSRHAKAGRLDELRAAQARGIEISFLLALPAAAALMVSARPIIEALFVRGQFTPNDALATAYTLAAYALGIPAYVLAKVLSTAFFAREDTKTPVAYSIMTVVANTVLALTLVFYAGLGFAGIALATGITAWLNVFLLARKLYQLKLLAFDRRLKHALPRLLLAAFAMAAVLFGIDHLFATWWLGSLLQRAIALTVLVGGGGGVYLLIVALTGVLKIGEFKALLLRAKNNDMSVQTP